MQWGVTPRRNTLYLIRSSLRKGRGAAGRGGAGMDAMKVVQSIGITYLIRVLKLVVSAWG